ncbi:MAG TPA: DUF1552 domain-containing protein [Verrucomicrobiota bacterium]|nr:DUF1552 domain-containing protein [Verrucomicrobiota bacterium]
MGASIALPMLEIMTPRLRAAELAADKVARMVCVYTPHGVRNSTWYPEKTGLNYTMSSTLEALTPLREKVSILTGLCHPRMASNVGHAAAGRWLTGVNDGDRVLVDFASPNKALSVDQLVANSIGTKTRWPSLQLSTESGAGVPGRSRTLSFNARGLPLPSMNKPRAVFNRLFVPDTGKDRAAERVRYQRQQSLLDNVMRQSKALERRLGRADRERLDQYLASIREVELQIDRNQKWLDHPKPEVDTSDLQFAFKTRSEFLKVMYDLMFFSLQTDSTRIITFMSGVEVDMYKWGELGANKDYHSLQHHNGNKVDMEKLSKVDKREADLLAGFLTRLNETAQGDGCMLDHTMVLYGSGMNNGVGVEDGKGAHSTRKLPTLLAGGGKLGIKQGQHLVYEKDRTPLCNLHVTLMQGMGLERDHFVDGTGPLTGLI